jgi:hypothetical protein
MSMSMEVHKGARKPNAKEERRQRLCQQRAIFRLYSLIDGKTEFCHLLDRLCRRWPRSVGTDYKFILRLREMFYREMEFCGRPVDRAAEAQR